MVYENVLRDPANFDFKIENLGECLVNTPLNLENYIEEGESIVFPVRLKILNINLKLVIVCPLSRRLVQGPRFFMTPNYCRLVLLLAEAFAQA